MLIAIHQTNPIGLFVIMSLVTIACAWFFIALVKEGGKDDKDRDKRWIKMHPVEKDPEDSLLGDHITVWRKKAQ